MPEIKSNFPGRELFLRLFADRVYLVGGYVRDIILKKKEKNFPDLLVTEHNYEQITSKLSPFGKVNTVGRSFAIVKFFYGETEFDIAIPRRDFLIDPAKSDHKNFRTEAGESVSLIEDLKRRDFTVNSIALRLADEKLIDPFNGVEDIKNRLLRMTNPQAFSQDPLRVLRAARFASVLNFRIAEEIYEQSKHITLTELSAERIAEELFKILLNSKRPSRGLNELFKLGAIRQLFPELYRCTLTIQDSRFHPETDCQGHHTVFGHILITIDIVQKLIAMFQNDFSNEERRLTILLAALLHDIGKATTTDWEYKNGRLTIVSIFHDSQGVELARKFLDFLKIETRRGYPLKEIVLRLIQYHHRLYDLYRCRQEIGYKAFTRLLRDVCREDFLLLLLDFADRRSRRTQPLRFNQLDAPAKWYLKAKKHYQINCNTLQPLIQGRDLLPFGIPSSPLMGNYLKKLYELQLEGRFKSKEEGLKIFFQEILPVAEKKNNAQK